MDGAHPSELDLLAYVEDELPDERSAAVSEHVAACAACGDAVRALERGRHALRSAPTLELPADRRAAVVAGLPARPARRRGWSWRPRLVVPALATVAVAAVLAGVIVTADWSPADENAAMVGEDEAEEAGGEAAPATPAQTTQTAPKDRALSTGIVRSVEGTPHEVAARLRSEGFDARVVDSSVEVRGADRNAVRRALAGRPDGPVPVVVP